MVVKGGRYGFASGYMGSSERKNKRIIMNYIKLTLLSIENLAISLLLVAMFFTLLARVHQKWIRIIICAPFVLLMFSGYVGLDIEAASLKFIGRRDSFLFYFTLALTFGFLIGTVSLYNAGLKQKKNIMLAASWPLGKLSLALFLALILHLSTIWILDYQGRQQQAILRIKASILGLSIAPPRVPDIDNAAFLYAKAGDIIRSAIDEMPKKVFEEDIEQNPWYRWQYLIDEGKLDPKDPELERFLQQQSQAIAFILRATHKPQFYVEYEYESPAFILTGLSGLNTPGQISGTLVLDARWKAANGHLKAAIEDLNAMFILAGRLRNDLMFLCWASDIEWEATETLQTILATTPLKQEELDILLFDDDYSYQRNMQRAFHYEEALQLKQLSNIGKYHDDYQLKWFVEPPREETILKSFLYRALWLYNDIECQQIYSRTINDLLSEPYYLSKKDMNNFLTKLKIESKSVTIENLYVGLDRWIKTMVLADARHQVAGTALAMCRYRAKNGKYPEKLEDLIPDFIASVPLDPIDGKQIRLKRTDGKIVIYSIGPDEIDDGGVPYDLQSRKGDITFELPNK
jgi:hypothetical protein